MKDALRRKSIYPAALFSAALFFAALVPALLTGGCSAKGPAAQAEMAAAQFAETGNLSRTGYSAPGMAKEVAEEAADSGGPNVPGPAAGPGAEAPRKLVKQAFISIRVPELTKASAAVDALMEQHGAYASSANIWENSRHYTIRVPAASYTALLAALDGMGRLLRRSESAEDVTLQYYDLEGRLATKRELLKTYRSYLGRAKNIEEILSVEAKIAELEDEIDGTGKELRALAGRVDHATIELEILGPENIPSYASPTLGDRVRGLFASLGGFFSTLLVGLLGVVVYGIPGILILALLFWLLFGRVGLVKKLWRLAAGKDAAPPKPGKPKDNSGKLVKQAPV
jgi:hypothetical protein